MRLINSPRPSRRTTAALARRFFRFAFILCAGAVLNFATGCSPAANLLAPLSITSFTATPATITTGQSTTLMWTVVGAQSLSVSDGINVLTSAQLTTLDANTVSITPAATTTYLLTAVDPNGNSIVSSTTVTVVPPPSITNFTASPTVITSNQTTTLSWTVVNAVTIFIDNNVGYPPLNNGSGTDVVTPNGTTTYTLTATNAAGTSVSATATVNVVPAPSITSFVANPPKIGIGSSTTLSWSVVGATSLSIDNGIGPVGGNSISVTPSQTTTYTLTAVNALGTFSVSSTASVTVQVLTTPPPTISAFSSSAASTGIGDAVTLTPVFVPTDGSATASIDNGVGTVTSGVPVDTPPLTGPTTFTLTVTNASGSVTAQQRVIAGELQVYAGAPGGTGSADGIGRSAHFNQPYGVATDGQGNLFVADTGNNTIREIAPGGVVTTFAGSATAPPGSVEGIGSTVRFSAPSGVAVDSSGNVYVADTGNDTIRVLTPQGSSRTLAGTPGVIGNVDGTGTGALFNGPEGIAVDSNGNVFVTDANCNIREISPQGVSSTIAGGNNGICGYADGIGGAAQFNAPDGIVVDPSGNIYVADQFNNRIRKLTPTASGYAVSTFAGSTRGVADGNGTAASFNHPAGLALDTLGNLYVCDASYTIRRIDTAANVTTIVGHPSVSNPFLPTAPLPATISSPFGIAADPVSGNLFVSYSVSAISSSPY